MPWSSVPATSCRPGVKPAFQKRIGSLPISRSWAWISPQKTLVFTAAKRVQSNFTEQLTVSLGELRAAKEYWSIWMESKFPPIDLHLKRAVPDWEEWQFPQRKGFAWWSFLPIAYPSCSFQLQITLIKTITFFLIACSVFCPCLGFREEKRTWKYISKVQATSSGYVNLTSPTAWHTVYYCKIRYDLYIT